VTLRVYLGLTDPSARRRIRELIGKDPGIVLVTEAEDADVVVGDAASMHPVSTAPVSDAGTALTSREREVLRLMAQGLGNKGIGTALNISTHTAKYHVASVLAKLDAQSRTEAVTKGLREGLLPL
jgi:DNA-binding CsgD family transcriptional regulator